MKINEKGLQLIKDAEGLRLRAYDDGFGVLTIGYGYTKGVFEGMTITQEEAEELLIEDIRYFERRVTEVVKVPITSNQFSALVSFTFNLGETSLRLSTLLNKLNNGDYLRAADEFLRWNKVDGVAVEGLTRRREAERKLFLTEDETSKSDRERFEEIMNQKVIPYQQFPELVEELLREIENNNIN